MSKRSFKDFCLDYESDYDKKPNAFEVWEELESQLTAMRERAEKAEYLFDTISDVLYGGESAWRNVDFKEFGSHIRKSISDKNKLAEANTILSEELQTVEGALKLSAAKYNQESAIKAFANVHGTALAKYWKERAEAAEQRIRESQEQEPDFRLTIAIQLQKHDDVLSHDPSKCYVTDFDALTERAKDSYLNNALFHCRVDSIYYAIREACKPIIPPSLEELQRNLQQIGEDHANISFKYVSLERENAELIRKLSELTNDK